MTVGVNGSILDPTIGHYQSVVSSSLKLLSVQKYTNTECNIERREIFVYVQTDGRSLRLYGVNSSGTLGYYETEHI